LKHLLLRSLVTLFALALAAVPVAAAVLWHQGYRVYAVRTGSMTPAYPTGAMVLDGPVPRQISPGDVITFGSSGSAALTTHRVVQVKGDLLQTKGDANSVADPATVNRASVVGQVLTGIDAGGYVLVFLKQPSGIASVMTMLLSLVLLRGLYFPPSPARHRRAHRTPAHI
jgi:signal peptidase